MLLSLDSDSDTGKHEGFRIGSSGIPVRWNGDDWTFYQHAMINAFEERLLDQIAIGKETLYVKWGAKKNIIISIQGSLSMEFEMQVVMKGTGTEMWS
ncbi:hypothetical protein DD238_000510 [Peronospora effusa]|uniref:Uncharacterized protein n=1 Tax=Peronospora effusa TaxID=542832 RepID=A0A3M6VQQ9_9STRA|nr:hypothetical protein DD238_000510 [Peronospora effusa]